MCCPHLGQLNRTSIIYVPLWPCILPPDGMRWQCFRTGHDPIPVRMFRVALPVLSIPGGKSGIRIAPFGAIAPAHHSHGRFSVTSVFLAASDAIDGQTGVPGTIPDVSGTVSDAPGTKTDALGMVSDVPETIPGVPGTVPDAPGTIPDAPETVSDVSGMVPDTPGMKTDASGMETGAPGAVPDAPGMKPGTPGSAPETPRRETNQAAGGGSL